MFHRGRILFLSATLALLAALGLGLAALYLSRHEEEFRRNERRELLRAECRLLAAQCVQELDRLRQNLIRQAAATPPEIRAVREAAASNSFFVAGFIARRSDGKLFYPADGGNWSRRYEELFTGMIAPPRDADYANVIMPREAADLYRDRNQRDDASGILPMREAGQIHYDRQEEKAKTAAEPMPENQSRDNRLTKAAPAAEMDIAAAKPSGRQGDFAVVGSAPDASSAPAPATASLRAARKAESAPAKTLPAGAARSEAPGSLRSGRQPMVTRFTALIRNQEGGFIPWFSDNSFTPLIWAQSQTDPTRIVGFELENTMIAARLLPLFPSRLPPYFRLELTDAGNRVLHAVGGDPESAAEPVLVMPFPELLLPNAQLRAYLLEAHLPLSVSGWGWVLGLTALLLVLLGAGGLAAALMLRELHNARRKTNFVSRVSHELRTPLTGICLYSELLRDHPELTPEKHRRYLEYITAESERLSRLIGNILDFGRLSERRKHYRPEKIVLSGLLNHALEVYAELAAQAGMEFLLEIAPGNRELTAMIDRDSLLQVLYNLFDNALKYAADGRQVMVTLARENGRTAIHVRDYGPGIPSRSRRKVFREFYRVDDRLCAATGGCGLGLAIARTLLRDQGGDLELRPARPGCDFVIILPGDTAHD